MIRKLFIYLILSLFTTATTAEELIMKCGESTYKYIKDPSGDKVFWKSFKGTKNKYQEWCAKIPAKNSRIISVEGWARIIKDYKATCMVKKILHNDNTASTNSISVSDFVKLTRHTEWYHPDTGNVKQVRDFNCKKKKK